MIAKQPFGRTGHASSRLERLRTDYVDLWQLHGLTGAAGWERAMGPGGALEAMLWARDQGLVRFLGVTGHGSKAAAMHRRSLESFDFDAVMLPYNYPMMCTPRYTAAFQALDQLCRQRQVALQTIKCIARCPAKGGSKTYNTYFYEPLEEQGAIDRAVHWVLGHPNVFVASTGDMQLLPRVLDAASRFQARPTDAEMDADVARFDIRPVWK